MEPNCEPAVEDEIHSSDRRRCRHADVSFKAVRASVAKLPTRSQRKYSMSASCHSMMKAGVLMWMRDCLRGPQVNISAQVYAVDLSQTSQRGTGKNWE